MILILRLRPYLQRLFYEYRIATNFSLIYWEGIFCLLRRWEVCI